MAAYAAAEPVSLQGLNHFDVEAQAYSFVRGRCIFRFRNASLTRRITGQHVVTVTAVWPVGYMIAATL
jgi:hypothetical protein